MPFKESWTFPGGFMNMDETTEVTVAYLGSVRS